MDQGQAASTCGIGALAKLRAILQIIPDLIQDGFLSPGFGPFQDLLGGVTETITKEAGRLVVLEAHRFVAPLV